MIYVLVFCIGVLVGVFGYAFAVDHYLRQGQVLMTTEDGDVRLVSELHCCSSDPCSSFFPGEVMEPARCDD